MISRVGVSSSITRIGRSGGAPPLRTRQRWTAASRADRCTGRLITQHHLVAGSGKMRLDKLSRHGVILNHKNPRRLFRLCTGLADSGAGLSQSRGSRQGEKEATSLARLALETELAALQFNQALGDGQAQARTFCGLTGLRETVEGVKDALLILGGNSWPGI